MCVVHIVQVLCLAQLTCYGRVWCVGCEELVKCVRCVCVWLGRHGWEGGEWVKRFGLGFNNPVRTGEMLEVCLCLGCGGVGGEWTGGLDQGLEGWDGVMSL